MGELIAALLVLAREETTPHNETCDARRIAHNCIERYRPFAASRGTVLSFVAPPVVDLKAPPALFAITLANLVHNALAHTRDGEVAVELDRTRLTVRDSGCGIQDEALAFPSCCGGRCVTRGTLRADLLAGLSGALIVLPQGVAFATIAGLPPQYGLYAAMAPAVIARCSAPAGTSCRGRPRRSPSPSSRRSRTRREPGSAEYIRLALTLTFLVGVFQLALGLARMGALVNFISHTVVIGFTAGAAILIAASQVRSFFGIDIPRGTPFYEIARQLVVQRRRHQPLGRRRRPRHAGHRPPHAPLSQARALHDRAMLVGSLVAEAINLWQGQGRRHRHRRRPAGQLPPLSLPDFSLDALRHPRPGAGHHHAGADRSRIHRARHRRALRAAHRRQPGVHRPGAVQHRRRLLLRLCLERLLQPQRRELRGRRAHAAGLGVRLGVPDPGAAGWWRRSRLPADRRHGRHPVPGRLGPDRLPPHRPHLAHQQGRDGDPLRHPDRHAVQPGGGHLPRRHPLADDVSLPHLAPGDRPPGAGGAGRRLPLRARQGAPECPQLRIVRINGASTSAPPATCSRPAGDRRGQPAAEIGPDRRRQHQYTSTSPAPNPGAGSAPAPAAGRRPVFLPPQPGGATSSCARAATSGKSARAPSSR
jgi:hypothetical protein